MCVSPSLLRGCVAQKELWPLSEGGSWTIYKILKRGSDWEVNGAPGESRTPDLLVRSQSLYPTELRAHTVGL